MSDKMRRYMIAFCILLVFSSFHFALAAPVAVREMLKVRSNAADVLKDGITAWEKRMDFNGEDHWSTNDAYLMDADSGSDSDSKADSGSDSGSKADSGSDSGSKADPGNDSDSDDAPGGDDEGGDDEGVKEEDMWGWKSPWDSDQLGDSDWDDAPGGDDEGVDEGVKEEDKWGWESPLDSDQMGSNGRGPDPYYNNPPEEESGDKDDGSNGNDDGGDDDNAMQSSQGSAENMGLGPESEHPATTPEHMTYIKKLLKALRLSRRNSSSDAVGTPKEGTVDSDTKAYVPDSSLPLQTTQVTNILTLSSMVRARVSSVSRLASSALVQSRPHDLPVHRQNRKKWILDRLD
ncbi:hypothetical protein F5888DRAFT_1638311 [Russula emetica]|nr:hypothetical protein F5888DRAFT_1638311 [Russula emetica]